MDVLRIFVDDSYIDEEDGFTLLTDDTLDAALIVKTALENGFRDIRISKADADEIVKYHKNKGEQ